MAKVCYSCGKKPDFGNARSHSLRATRRRRDPNLQKVRIQEGSPHGASGSATHASRVQGQKVSRGAPSPTAPSV